MRVHLEFIVATDSGMGIILRLEGSQMCFCATKTTA